MITMRSEPHILLMIESPRESGRKLIAGVADYAHHFGPWQFHREPLGVKGLSSRVKEGTFDGMLLRDVADLEGFQAPDVPCVVFSYELNIEREVGIFVRNLWESAESSLLNCDGMHEFGW